MIVIYYYLAWKQITIIIQQECIKEESENKSFMSSTDKACQLRCPSDLLNTFTHNRWPVIDVEQ
jgi:hypothetical protein